MLFFNIDVCEKKLARTVHLGNGKQHISTIIDAANDPAPLGNAQQYCSVYNFQLVFRGLFFLLTPLCLITQKALVRQ
jgi:hypothetical protein